MINVDIIMLSFAKDDSLKKMTQDAIDSLFNSEIANPNINFKCIVVESNNEMGDYQYSGARTIYPNQKFGFHKFLNIGIRETNSEYVCLVNNDILFDSGWCSALLEAEKKLQLELKTDIISFGCIDPNNHPARHNLYPTKEPKYLPGYQINKYVTGWCLFHKRKLYEITGELDERFIGWYSDDDFSMNLKKHNIPHYLVLNSVVRHFPMTTTNKMEKGDFNNFTTGQYSVFYNKWAASIERPELSFKLGAQPEKIGIGITTCKRHDIFRKSLENIVKYTPKSDNIKIVVSDDTADSSISNKNKYICNKLGVEYHNNSKTPGIALNKNRTLYLLQDCDYIFLMDDDVYPVKEGWLDLYISTHKKTGIHHFNYNPYNEFANPIANPTRILTELDGGKILVSSGGAGVLLFFTKKTIKFVGGMNPAFGKWGHEHIELSHRIYNFGLTKNISPFISPAREEDYIYALDFFEKGVPSTVDPIEKEVLRKKYEPLFEGNKNKKLYIDFNKLFKKQRIPKIMHHIALWGMKLDLPNLKSWQERYPDWQHMIWDDEKINNLFLVNYNAYATCPHLPGRIEVAKYEILNKYGGFFIDPGLSEPQKLKPEVLEHSFVVSGRMQDQKLEITSLGLGCEPGTRQLEALIVAIKTRGLPKNFNEYNLFFNHTLKEFIGQDCNIVNPWFTYP